MMQSIYEFIKRNLNKEGYLNDSRIPLPDMGDMTLSEGEKWEPGAYEGILLRSEYAIKQPVLINFHIANVIKKHMKQPNDKNFSKMIAVLSKYSALSIADPVISFLANSDKERLRGTAVKIIEKTPKREALKVGIALLGQGGNEDDESILKALGSHEEFTLYTTVASKNIIQDYNRFLLELLPNLCGWGKISAIYELDFSREESRFYVLTEGCDNAIGLSYLANVCAIKGKMADRLEQVYESRVDINALYKGACDIFSGLLEMHPVNDTISEYPDAERAAKAFYRMVSACEIVNRDGREEQIINKLREFRYI